MKYFRWSTAQQAEELRAKQRFQDLALKALRQERKPWARQNQYAALRRAVAAGGQGDIKAAKDRCRLFRHDVHAVRDYICKQYREMYDAARAAFGEPVNDNDPLCRLVLDAHNRYMDELLGKSQSAADGKDSDSARDLTATSAGTAAPSASQPS